MMIDLLQENQKTLKSEKCNNPGFFTFQHLLTLLSSGRGGSSLRAERPKRPSPQQPPPWFLGGGGAGEPRDVISPACPGPSLR